MEFPSYSGTRCLMMPYVQGDPESVPAQYASYAEIIERHFIEAGRIGFLTIDESPTVPDVPHRGTRAKFGRALHTEAGMLYGQYTWDNPQPYWSSSYAWGGVPAWGGRVNVTLDPDLQVLLANSVDDSCAYWNATHFNTSADGDIGDYADMYPYEDAVFMKAGEVHQIGILTPHESMPSAGYGFRQFLRIVGEGVHGREPYFTKNPLVSL